MTEPSLAWSYKSNKRQCRFVSGFAVVPFHRFFFLCINSITMLYLLPHLGTLIVKNDTFDIFVSKRPQTSLIPFDRFWKQKFCIVLSPLCSTVSGDYRYLSFPSIYLLPFISTYLRFNERTQAYICLGIYITLNQSKFCTLFSQWFDLSFLFLHVCIKLSTYTHLHLSISLSIYLATNQST